MLAMLIVRCPYRDADETILLPFQIDQHDAPWRVLTLWILPQDFSLPQAGDSFRFRHAPGTPDYGFTPDCSPERSWALFPSAIE
jgi:hypothetical protein